MSGCTQCAHMPGKPLLTALSLDSGCTQDCMQGAIPLRTRVYVGTVCTPRALNTANYKSKKEMEQSGRSAFCEAPDWAESAARFVRPRRGPQCTIRTIAGFRGCPFGDGLRPHLGNTATAGSRQPNPILFSLGESK